MKIARDCFPFTQDKYPNGDLSSQEKILAFSIRHSQAHIAKSLGKIAAEAEEHNHGSCTDMKALKITTTKMVVNVFAS